MSKDKHIVAVSEARPAAGSVPSASPIYRHAGSKDELPKLPEVSSLYELFVRSVEKYSGNECLGQRVSGGPFVWQTYKEVAEEVAQLASGLRAIGVTPKQRVGVFGPNCPSWMKAMQVSMNVRGNLVVSCYLVAGDLCVHQLEARQCSLLGTVVRVACQV
jgi:long-chain acyl-CoA synthetase